MIAGKILKIFKKGAKAASKHKGKKGTVAAVQWPAGIRIGIFGHQNSGKTVYLTVLNEESKISKELQISVTDNATAGEFLNNYRQIWGLGTSADSGTVVDMHGERKFPDSTKAEKVLQFTAILNRTHKIPVVTYDYNGEAVSIAKQSELSDKVFDFMTGCDGILFFFDPKILGAEIEIQSHAASFVNMLEQIAPLSSRMPIPVGLVVTKADILPGFTGESQTVLVGAEDEQFFSDDFEIFLEKVLNSNRIASNAQWAGSVRNILVKLREFLRVVVGRTLNFQIFFISNTGDTPEKIGVDVGRSVYMPPSKIRPSGVKEPFAWILGAIMKNRRLTKLRSVTKFVAIISIAWMLLYSLPFIYHFSFLLPRPYNVEESILKNYDGNVLGTSQSERSTIMNAYSRYKDSWLVKKMFRDFQIPAKRIYDTYRGFNTNKSIEKLENLINRFSLIVRDSASWPKLNPANDSIIYTDRHDTLIADLEELHVGDETSALYRRSDRALTFWDLFNRYIQGRRDSVSVGLIMEQVQLYRESAKNISSAENKLMETMSGLATAQKKVVAKQVDTQKGLEEYEGLKKRINNSTDAAFLLGRAVRELKQIKGRLHSSNAEQIAAINSYLKAVERYDKKRQYTCKLETVPDMGHLHIEVTPDGQSPQWNVKTQLLEGDEHQMEWRTGYDIHIAFDELKHNCQWGNIPSDKIVLKDKYSLFGLEGNLTFPNIGKTITISFKGGLKEKLPKLK
jgi:hypothetical protein